MVMRPKELTDLTDYTASSVRTMYNSSGKLVFAPHNLIKSSEDFASSDWIKTNTTVTSNAAMAPDGTLTADKISHTSTSGTLSQVPSLPTGASYRVGVVVRNIDASWFRLYLEAGSQVYVNLSDGSIGTNTANATVTQLSNGVFYIVAEAVSASTFGRHNMTLRVGDLGNVEVGTSAYIWGAHLYENGLGGMADVPEDERAIPALTKYVPNKAVTIGSNLVSNGTFDSNTNGWTADNSAALTVDTGRLKLENGATAFGRAYQAVTTVSGKHYKAIVGYEEGSSAAAAAGVDVQVRNGTVSGTILANSGAVAVEGAIVVFFTASSSTSVVRVGNATTVASEYSFFDNITVEEVDRNPSAARFLPRRNGYIYDNGSWVRGLTWESEARTNLDTDFNAFGSWGKARISTVTQDAASVDGTTSAWTVTPTTATDSHYIYKNHTYTTGWHTIALNLGYVNHRWACVRIYDGSAHYTQSVDLLNGVLGTGAGSATGHARMWQVGAGLYRVAVSANFTVGGAGNTVVLMNNTDSVSFPTWTPAGTEQMTVSFHQNEAGSTPSSLIPTYGATRTRTAETLKDKADKIVWPATTYVTGAELVTNGTFDTDTDWTKQAGWSIGSGVASVDSSAAGTTNLTSTGMAVTIGSVYEVTYTINSVSGSGIRAQIGGYVEAGGYNTSTGTKSFIFTATTTTGLSFTASSADTVGSIDNISVKEINPRAKCVVMHGYMTYADTSSNDEVVFCRQYADADNYTKQKLYTTGSYVGSFVAEMESNGNLDQSSLPGAYSPGVNQPFKIASRHLDNAIQGAADGTATTENTTPPGLPDLSSTQTEWFYDFMGHVTGVSVFVDDIGESGLTFGTGNTYLA